MKFLILMIIVDTIISIYFGSSGNAMASMGFFIVSQIFIAAALIFQKIDGSIK